MNWVRKKDPKSPSKKDQTKALWELGRLIKWVSELDAVESFSQEWILQTLEELTLQCMGKRQISVHGIPMQLFDAKNAIKAIKLGAEVQGFLHFPNRKLTVIPGQLDGPVEPVQGQLQTDAERTEAVYAILNKSQVFPQPPALESNITDVEVL